MMTFQGRVHVLSSLHVSPSWQSKNTPCHPLFYPYIKNNKKIMTSIFTINSVQFSRLLILRCSNLIYWESGSLRWLFFTNSFIFSQIIPVNCQTFCSLFWQITILYFVRLLEHWWPYLRPLIVSRWVPSVSFFWRRAPLFLFTLPKTFSTLSMATFRKGVRE